MQGPEKNANRHADHLTVFCPATHGSIQTTIATDVPTLAKAWHPKSRSLVLTAARFTSTECVKRLYRPQFHIHT